MADVAREAGVSRALVSIVFRDAAGASEATRARVRAAAARIGYQPNLAARHLARGPGRAIGVLMTLRNPFHASLVESVEQGAAARGREVILATVGPSRAEAAALAALAGQPCAGYVLLGPTGGVDGIVALNAASPVVVVGEPALTGVVDVVHSDDAAGVRAAMDHLGALGHRRIAHVSGTGSAMRAREAAYREWMARRAAGEEADVIAGSDTEAGGRAAAEALAGRALAPTAVLAANDRCAVGLLHGLGRAGVAVPGEMSVAGFDDIDMGQFGAISLTTVHQDAAALAARSLEFLEDRIGGLAAPARSSVLTPVLRVRATTAPPRPARSVR
jgi:DNA-binding LacI/PurR family transcriptional regulator